MTVEVGLHIVPRVDCSKRDVLLLIKASGPEARGFPGPETPTPLLCNTM